MIVLDTNVVSELMAKSPHPKVAEWSRKFRRDELAMTTITFMELRMGIETLPASKRRVGLEADLDWVLAEVIGARMLVFDQAAAEHAVKRVALLKRTGQPVEIRDVQIAGVAMARRAVLATRNLKDYEQLTVKVVNPWGD